jgi:hypothetical protein
MDEPLIVNLADAPARGHPRRAAIIELERDGVLMIGSRRVDGVRYTVNELAARYEASVNQETDEPAEAYADWSQDAWEPIQNPWPLGGAR